MKAIFLAGLVLVSGSAISGNQSIYTGLTPTSCTVDTDFVPSDGELNKLNCPALSGHSSSVIAGEDDFSYLTISTPNGSVSVAPKLDNLMAVYGVGDKLEWRLSGNKPIAAINRFSIRSFTPDRKKLYDVLAVTRLTHRPCVVAIIRPDNVKARQIADVASNLPCLPD